MKIDEQRIWNFFRPFHGQIVEFDLERDEYLSWASSLVYKYRIRKLPSEERPLRIEKRFIVGYSKKFWPRSDGTERPDDYHVIVHYIGGEGLKTHQTSELNDLDFLLIRRPFLGTIIILVLLGIGSVIAVRDWCRDVFVRTKARGSRWVNRSRKSGKA